MVSSECTHLYTSLRKRLLKECFFCKRYKFTTLQLVIGHLDVLDKDDATRMHSSIFRGAKIIQTNQEIQG